VQLDGYDGNNEKPDNILNRQHINRISQQLSQSKSTDSLTNKNRLQFIQQKFKEKE
jgi:hypothetical protein